MINSTASISIQLARVFEPLIIEAILTLIKLLFVFFTVFDFFKVVCPSWVGIVGTVLDIFLSWGGIGLNWGHVYLIRGRFSLPFVDISKAVLVLLFRWYWALLRQSWSPLRQYWSDKVFIETVCIYLRWGSIGLHWGYLYLNRGSLSLPLVDSSRTSYVGSIGR